MSPFMGVSGLGGAGSLIGARVQTDLSKKHWYIHFTPTFSSGVSDLHVDVDSEGNVFTAARYSPSGSGGQYYHLIVAKYDTFGVFQWQKSAGSTDARVMGVGVDNDGNFYITGWIYKNLAGVATFGPMFIIKYNSSGVIQWQRELDTYRSDYNAFKVDGSGNVYVGAQVNNSTYSGGNPLPYLLAKYNSSGVLQWKIQLRQPYVASGSGQNMEMEGESGIEVDSSGNVILTGTIDYNTSNFRGGFVAKFNSSGVMQWQRRLDIGNNAFDSTYGNYDAGSNRYSIACDSSDNIYITGSYLPYVAGGSVHRTVLVKYDSSGTLQWSKVLYMEEGNYYKKYHSYGVDADTDGNVYVLGNFEDHKYRESNSTANTAVILTKWDSSGNLQYERTIDAPEWYNVNANSYSPKFGSSYYASVEPCGTIKSDSENNLYFAVKGFAPKGFNSSWSGSTNGIGIFKIPSDGSKTGAYQNYYYRPFPDIYNGFREDYHKSGFVGIASTKDVVGYAGSLTSTTDTLHTDSAGSEPLVDNSSSVSLWNTATILISDTTVATSHVTDGLSFHIDAGNTSCVSWTGRIAALPSGTYEVNSLVGGITSSNINSTVAHSPSNGGYWIFIYGHVGTQFGMEFDGDFADVTGSTDFSYDFWFRHRWYSYSYENPFGIIGLSKTSYGGGTWGGSGGNEHLHSFIGDQSTSSGSRAAYYKLPTYDVNGAVNGFSDYSFSPIKSTGNWDDNGGNWQGNDNWWHVAVTFDTSNTLKSVYVNGTLINTITNSAYSSIVSSGRSGTGRLYVGGMTGYNPLNGDVAIVRFYKNKILSASEVLQNYNAEKTRFGLNYSATAYT